MSANKKKARLIGKDRFALKDAPVFGVVVIMLFTLGIVLLPGEKLGALLLGEKGVDARNLGNTIFRAAGTAVMVLLALDIGWDIFGFTGRGRGFLLALPFVAVAVNNLPIVGLARGTVHVHAGAGSIALFAANCLAVGLFEETVFRGVIFPLILRRMKDDRMGIFLAIVISSVLFGAVHLVNLLSGFNPAVFLQVGYSTLIGAMCAMVMLLTRNVFACAFLHAGFNFCGLLADELGSGPVWDGASIALTAIVGVLAVAYGVLLLVNWLAPLGVLKLYAEKQTQTEKNKSDGQ